MLEKREKEREREREREREKALMGQDVGYMHTHSDIDVYHVSVKWTLKFQSCAHSSLISDSWAIEAIAFNNGC